MSGIIMDNQPVFKTDDDLQRDREQAEHNCMFFTGKSLNDFVSQWEEFGVFVEGLSNSNITDKELKTSYCMGLAGECSEVVCLFTEPIDIGQDHEEEVLKEFSDVTHYLRGQVGQFQIAGPVASGAILTSEQYLIAVQDLAYDILTNEGGGAVGYSIKMLKRSCKILDEVKKVHFHDKKKWKPEQMEALYIEVGAYLTAVGTSGGITLPQMIECNIAKLSERHPGGKFSGDYHNEPEGFIK